MGAAVVSIKIGAKYRLGYEIGSVEGFGDSATKEESCVEVLVERERDSG